jgi:hypothetical protein
MAVQRLPTANKQLVLIKLSFVATGGVNILNTGIVTVNSIKSFNAGSPLTIVAGANLIMVFPFLGVPR